MVRNGDFADKTRKANLYKPINCCYYQFLPTFGTFLFRNVQFKTEGKKCLTQIELKLRASKNAAFIVISVGYLSKLILIEGFFQWYC